MNEFQNGPIGRFDAMYYWEQFHPIISAVAILFVGWIIALLVAGAGSAKLAFRALFQVLKWPMSKRIRR